MVEAINSGVISGAGLDVLEGEELIKEEKELLNDDKLNSSKLKEIVFDHQLLHNSKVVFTPHIAFYSQEAINNIIDITISNIQSFIKNKPQNTI